MTLALLFVIGLAHQETPIVLDGAVPGGDDDYFDLPFEVPAGTREIEVAHLPTNSTSNDVLDWGLYDPSGGYRGWGGGNLENAIVGDDAASRSYLPGPLPAGTWTVNVGKARVASANLGYHVEITLRADPTLPAQVLKPYVDAAPVDTDSRFYAGDFHVHSEDSGDARPPLDEIAAFALGQGLDFVVITDHNTSAQIDKLVDAQTHNPELLLLPGVEFTTYGGHATGFGATRYVDHRIGHNGRTVEAAIKDIAAQGALFSINHPALDLGDVCIGCAWTHGDPALGTIQGVEIETGGFDEAGGLFSDRAITFWEDLLDKGHHLAALGGSDDHQAGTSGGSPIGHPTTMVFAANLTEQSLRVGILNSRTVVKLQDSAAPMIDLQTDPVRTGDTAIGNEVTLTAVVTGGVGSTFRFVENGLGVDIAAPITTDPQSFTVTRTPDATGTDRLRAEVDAASDGHPLTVTSYVWLKAGPPESGCTCGTGGDTAPALLTGTCVALFARRRRLRSFNQLRAE